MWWLLPFLSTDAEAGSEERAARRDARQVRKHMGSLGQLTDDYWRALRWGDVTGAAIYLESAERRTQWVASEVNDASFRVQHIEILRIDVAEPAVDEAWAREAYVLFQVEGYAPSSQKLEKTTRIQTWRLYPAGWFVESGDEYGHLLETTE
ncbi:MAG: hypothetical protein GY913_28345 [Proteobacteria bacterium]|nr:hypothetical protein [Pseudomonadota bacterium]MCP4920823.1 hypothetical protein [Pseudomonadota bacterium]